MKKMNAILMGVVLCCTGCAASARTVPVHETEIVSQEQSEIGAEQTLLQETDSRIETESDLTEVTYYGYAFETNETVLEINTDVEEVLSAIGESKNVFEAPSCAGQGVSYLYDFGSFEIETYPDETTGKNLIGYIVLKDDTVTTMEGADLSMTKEDIINLYGTDCEEEENRITYCKDEMKLNFVFEEDNMVSIEYVSSLIG